MNDWNITPEQIEERLASWDDMEWAMYRENFSEYKGALGHEATKTFEEFAWGIAAQNILFTILRGEAA